MILWPKECSSFTVFEIFYDAAAFSSVNQCSKINSGVNCVD